MKPALILLSMLAVATARTFGLELTAANWEKAHAVIRPQADEDKWMAIAWETDILEARKRATTEEKPIFLWEMDGHPLGCT
jgi:hypothetical protein